MQYINMHHKKITNFGYGGIKCSCCTPFNTVKKNQKLSNKRLRQTLDAEMEEEAARTIQWYNYWDTYYSPEEDENRMQSFWEEENVRYYHNYMEGRDAMEDSSVYSKNTYEW